MPNIVAVDQQSKGNIKVLGQLIRDCRGTLSQSKLAKKVGLPRSNMKYIEDGVNAPTAEVYEIKWMRCTWQFGGFLRRIFAELSQETRI